MSSIATQLGQSYSDHPLRLTFLKWQCRVRQLNMREADGRPDDAIMPAVHLDGADEPLGHIITVMNKSPGYSVTPELEHMARKTHDPAQRRDAALKFLSASYYQKAAEFSDILTATFPPGSDGAATIRRAKSCRLVFEAYAQRFDLSCKVWKLAQHNLLYQATMAHNRLFNPALPPDTIVLGFEPDWSASSSDAPR
ncbi:hypothetical protein EI983_01720 [Roseovarius faecimaris]|uniref:Uncharacterized protein n=1 Tax=Roseovarius faecimaris TaxID=2494550 RepID=A0A6I6IJR3_9RHOB|nr:hypothetical protein [Roseovarius faecimaris]QGX97059.1 hypothetical protein EI983_01720 [Roseovarius faecimaris]